MTRFAQIIGSYARIGVADVENSEKSARYAFNILCLLGGIAALSYMLMYFVLGHWQLALCSLFISSVGLLPLFTSGHEQRSAIFGVAIVSIGFTAMTYFAGRDTLLHLLIVLAVLNDVILRGTSAPRETMIFGGIATLVVVTCHLAFETPALGNAITPQFTRNLAALNIVCLGGLMIFSLLAMSQQIRSVQALLDAEHARSEALLQNLLPAEIAERLKSRPGDIIADRLPAVTLLFADIVDFTPRAARMTPEALVGFLNHVFSRFDVLTAERGLEKIKTIGDAYMVAAGLPVARSDHAQVIADMALEMRNAMRDLSAVMGEKVNLRIGIHSGPAIAGVIGTSKVFYDVWGDTVNTASRMESHGEPGRIQVTDATRSLLADRFAFSARGPVEVKGIGRINTWWLTDRL